MTGVRADPRGDAEWLLQVARDWLARADGGEPLLDPGVPDNAEATRRAIRNFLAKDGETEEVTVEDGDVHQAAIAAARELYADDNIEIDAAPEVAEAEEGVWVAAWVWVAREDANERDGPG